MKEEEGCCIGFSHCVCGIHASLCHSQANQPLGEMLWLTSIQTRQFKTFPFFLYSLALFVGGILLFV